MKPDRRRALLLGILLSSAVVVTNLLLKREALVILTPEGEPVIVTSPLMYGLKETLAISIASAAAGFSLGSLLGGVGEGASSASSVDRAPIEVREGVMRILDRRDREIVTLLLRKGGEVLQSEVWTELGMIKATASRRLDSLEERGIVVREKLGGTYRVRLSDWLRKVLAVGH